MSEIISGIYAYAYTLAQSIRITDIVDIFVLSILFYQVIQFLRKTSSGRVMRGVLVLIVALGLSSTFQLYALTYLINRTMEGAFWRWLFCSSLKSVAS